MTRQTVGSMQCKMLIKRGHTEKFLKCRFFHARDVPEAHVIIDEGKNLSRIVFGKPQALADSFGDLYPNIDVPIETNTVRRTRKVAGLPTS